MPVSANRMGYLKDGLAGVICLLAVGWAMDVPRMLGIVLFVQQYMLFVLGLVLALVYLTLPFRRGTARPRAPLYDCLAAATSVVVYTVLAWRYPVLSEEVFFHMGEGFTLGAIILVLTIEGLRRATGWPLVSVALGFILYGLAGHLIPGQFNGRYVPYDEFFAYLAIDPNALPGVPLIVGATIVIAFVFFGQLLKYAGGSLFFTDLSMALMGSFRGGSAKISIVASSLFGAISGSAVSNVVSTGVITIPLMRQGGYTARRAAAIEAVASTGGQLMPPIMGAAAFLMAEFIQAPYTDVVLAATIPAVLYYLTVFIQADLDAAQAGIDPVPVDERPPLLQTLRSGWHFLLPFAVLISALFIYNQPPERAALYGALAIAVGGLVRGYNGKLMKLSALWDSVRDTGKAVLDILLIVAAAGIVIGALNVTGLSFSLTLTLVQLGGDNLVVLLLVSAAIGIVLGMGMPTVGVYVLLATLIAPALVQAGVSLIAAHMFVLYFGMLSMITPPIALAAFTAAGLAKADPMRTGLEAVRYGWSAYIVPFVFVFSPELLMQGDAAAIILALARAAFAVWLVSLGAVGYFRSPIGKASRLLFVVAGLLLLAPAAILPGAAIWLTFAGFAGAAIALSFNWRKRSQAST